MTAHPQIVNFQPVLKGEVYGPLRDTAVFDQVSIDPEAHTLVWPGADFDPAIFMARIRRSSFRLTSNHGSRFHISYEAFCAKAGAAQNGMARPRDFHATQKLAAVFCTAPM